MRPDHWKHILAALEELRESPREPWPLGDLLDTFVLLAKHLLVFLPLFFCCYKCIRCCVNWNSTAPTGLGCMIVILAFWMMVGFGVFEYIAAGA